MSSTTKAIECHLCDGTQWITVHGWVKPIGPFKYGVVSSHRVEFYYTHNSQKLSGLAKIAIDPAKISCFPTGEMLDAIADSANLQQTDTREDFVAGLYTMTQIWRGQWQIDGDGITKEVPCYALVEELSKLGVPATSYPMGRERLEREKAAQNKPDTDWDGLLSWSRDD
jgi:hypothetical protein